MIDVSVSHDLHDSTILDYGCNQGGFLRMLYDRNPFRGAVGIDIARESVARADLLKGHRPIEYKVGDRQPPSAAPSTSPSATKCSTCCPISPSTPPT